MRRLLIPLAFSCTIIAQGASAQVVSGVATTAAPTYSNGAPAPLSLDLSGNLRTAGSGGGTTTLVPGTSGGTLTFDASVGIGAQAVKASAGQLYGYHIFNPNTATCYLLVYNLPSGSVTVGTTTPIKILGIPANGGAVRSFATGSALGGTGISVAATAARTGVGSCSPGAMDVDLDYF